MGLELKYRDTLNYAPVDVVKGIDLILKKVVMGDDLAPSGYEKRPMCKFCSHYLVGNDLNIGICQKGSYETYGDLWAKTCKDYQNS